MLLCRYGRRGRVVHRRRAEGRPQALGENRRRRLPHEGRARTATRSSSGDRGAAHRRDRPPDAVAELGAKTVEAVLLTHHHRDTAAFAARVPAKKVPVRAAKESADWLTPEGVAKFWKDSVPLRNSRTAYLVLPEGVEGIDCSLEDGKTIQLRHVERHAGRDAGPLAATTSPSSCGPRAT